MGNRWWRGWSMISLGELPDWPEAWPHAGPPPIPAPQVLGLVQQLGELPDWPEACELQLDSLLSDWVCLLLEPADRPAVRSKRMRLTCWPSRERAWQGLKIALSVLKVGCGGAHMLAQQGPGWQGLR